MVISTLPSQYNDNNLPSANGYQYIAIFVRIIGPVFLSHVGTRSLPNDESHTHSPAGK